MTVKTANGKEIEFDSCHESENHERLQIHLLGVEFHDVICLLANKDALPFIGYETYTRPTLLAEASIGVDIVVETDGVEANDTRGAEVSYSESPAEQR